MKNRASIAASLLQSPEMLKEAYAEATDAEGSAAIENEKYMDSVEGHLVRLKNAWEELSAMRTNTAPADAENPEENAGGLSSGVWLWIIGGTLAVLLCAVVLVLVLIHRKKVVETRMMEALAKSRETAGMAAVNRAVTNNETMTSTRVHTPKKSIIDEAEEFAAKRRETQAMQASAASEPKAAFEDENGVPENKILTSPFNGKTILRPTARERITSAMQSLSDVLHHDRTKVSLPKEQTPPKPEVAAPDVP